MEIKLDAEAAASIASAAIFDSLSQDMRDSVIKQAVQSLLAPDKNNYGRVGETPLQRAFNQALNNAAYRAVEEKVKNDPEVSAAISEMLGPLLNSALEAEGELWGNGLADALGSALGQWLAEKARSR